MNFREASAQWLGVVLDGLGLEQVNLVGLPAGGFVAAAFAFEQPERVKHLVFVGALPGLRRELPLQLRLKGHPLVGRLMLRMKITDPEVKRNRVFATLVAHPEALPVDFQQNDIDAWALDGAAQSGYTMMRSISTLRGLRSDMLIAKELPSLSCPTLFLWDDADRSRRQPSGSGSLTRCLTHGFRSCPTPATVPIWISLQSSPKRLRPSPRRPSPSAVTARAGCSVPLNGRLPDRQVSFGSKLLPSTCIAYETVRPSLSGEQRGKRASKSDGA